MAKKSLKSRAVEPLEDPIAGSVDHMIEVVVDVQQFQLEVQHPRSLVKPGDQVIWIFRGLPRGWLPWVEFPKNQPYGPFEGVKVGSNAVWATVPDGMVPDSMVPDNAGNEDEASVFPYRASIRKALSLKDNAYGALLRSPLADLEVRNLTPRNRVVPVTYDEATGGLVITNQLVKRNPGDTVEWVFEISPKVLKTSAWQPRIDFFRFDGNGPSEPPDLSLGPFSSLQMRSHSVLGSGSNGCPGIYSYVALAVAWDSDTVHLVSTPDPVIDDRGPVASSGPG